MRSLGASQWPRNNPLYWRVVIQGHFNILAPGVGIRTPLSPLRLRLVTGFEDRC